MSYRKVRGRKQKIRISLVLSAGRVAISYGELVLFDTDILLGRQQLHVALYELDECTPLDQGNISTIDRIWMWEMNISRGKIHLFAGNFAEALGFLQGMWLARKTETSTMCKIIAHLSIVFRELGELQAGVDLVSTQLNDLTAIQSRESGSAKRLRLTLA